VDPDDQADADLLDLDALTSVYGRRLATEILRRRGWTSVEADLAEELAVLIRRERKRPQS
jgi:hypothetical protein